MVYVNVDVGFTISEVAANWHEPMVPQSIMSIFAKFYLATTLRFF